MAHDFNYTIQGDSLQYVDVELAAGQSVVAEAGAMLYMTDGVEFETKMGTGESSGGVLGTLVGAAKRKIAGESLFLTHFSNSTTTMQHVGFGAPFPGSIVACNLQDHQGELMFQRDAFLAGSAGTSIDIAFNRRFGSGFFGGEGFILQRISGDGTVFVHAGGAVIGKQLRGETLRIDTGCIVGFERSIDYDIEAAGDLKSMMFGGEGMFLATLSGHGQVWLQTMPISRFIERVVPPSSD